MYASSGIGLPSVTWSRSRVRAAMRFHSFRRRRLPPVRWRVARRRFRRSARVVANSVDHRIRAVLFLLLDDPRDVEEASQDCLVNAWCNLDRFRAEATVFTWLYRIAVNEALARKRRKRLPLVELEATEHQLMSSGGRIDEPERAAEAGELHAFLAGRMRELPLEYRAPLVLRDLVGLSNEEVAGVLEIAVAAAKSRIHRARMQIREVIDAEDRGIPFGQLVVNGEEQTRDVIVLPDRVVTNWWRADGHRLVLADLDDVLEELPEHLVVGTGAYGQMRPDPETVEQLKKRGGEVEALPTGEAVRRYGELDPRRTAAALHLTC